MDPEVINKMRMIRPKNKRQNTKSKHQSLEKETRSVSCSVKDPDPSKMP